MKLDTHVVGNTGLYFTCYRLSRLGWNVMPTARNARGIDVVAYSRDGKRYVGIQVKSLSKRTAVPLGTTVDSLMGDFWVIINRVATDPTAFIMKPNEVRRRAVREQKDGRVSFWLSPNAYETDDFREAWDGIGRGDDAP